jgi:hypothetical protein
MKAMRFKNSEKRDKSISKEILKFTGERLPEYEWLQQAMSLKDCLKTGQER